MTGIWLLCISSPRCIQQSPLKFLYLIFVSLSLPVFYSFIGLANIPHLYSRSEEESRSQGKKAKLSQTPSHHQIVTSISVGPTALPLAAREPVLDGSFSQMLKLARMMTGAVVERDRACGPNVQ